MNKNNTQISQKLILWIQSFNFAGLILGATLFCFSFLPSILPRPWLMQGIISGVSLAIGYGLGVLVSKSIRWFMQKEPNTKLKKTAWQLSSILPALMLASVIIGHNWQIEVSKLVGQEPSTKFNILKILITATLIFYILIYTSRGIRALANKLSNVFSSRLPKRFGMLIGVSITVLIIVWIINGFLINTFINTANEIYSSSNDQPPEGVTQPNNPLRSGSPESLIAWDSLGNRGQSFVTHGPNQQQLLEFTGEKPMEQIRIYAGVKSAGTARERSRLVIEELIRTKAFDREVLILATATGSGWLEPEAMDSIEYMHGGNTAIVSQQYSYLPSWISFLVDSENAKNASRELYDAVYTEWSKLPEDSRPKLIVYGLSLGSFGAQSTFSSAQDVRRSADGALFIGTPSNTTLWRNITDNRDLGSSEIFPTYENSKTVRFAGTQSVITSEPDKWQNPRVLYMQHPSDPVIWWSFDLILHKPDWLKETRGSDVSPNTKWVPIVTFLHVSVDQFFGVNVPNGHGHNYADNAVAAWAAVAPETNWSNEKTDKLQKIIDTYKN